jgi:hypothetical protein
MTHLETAITGVREAIQNTQACIDIAGNTPNLIDGDELGIGSRVRAMNSGIRGMRAESNLDELFGIHSRSYETRAAANIPGARAELDRFEAQYSMFAEATNRFREACANASRRNG